MKLSLPPNVEKIIEECVKSGEFSSAEDVVTTAVSKLHEQVFDFAPGELDRLIAEADRSGPPIPYEAVSLRLKALREADRVGTP